jgi:hypothetical protein
MQVQDKNDCLYNLLTPMKTYLRSSLICAMVWPLTLLSLPAQIPQGPPENQGGEGGTIVDGVPSSTVASAASDTMDMGALTTPEEVTQAFPPVQPPGSTKEVMTTGNDQLNVEIGGGHVNFNGQTADIYTFKVPYSRKLSERATLQFSVPLSWATYNKAALTNLGVLKDARAYGGGLNLGYAYQAITKSDNSPYRWKLTPSAGLFYRDCADLSQGSLVFNIGLSSSFAWQFSPGWVVNVGNSISLAWNSGIRDYPDPIRDNQQMFSNGIQLYHLMDRWTVYGYIIDTEALKNVLVNSYQTYALGVGYKLTKSRSFKATLLYENGNGGYGSLRGAVSTTWQF